MSGVTFRSAFSVIMQNNESEWKILGWSDNGKQGRLVGTGKGYFQVAHVPPTLICIPDADRMHN